jgi:hypothetical protein
MTLPPVLVDVPKEEMDVPAPKGYLLFCGPLALTALLEFVHSDPVWGWLIAGSVILVALYGAVRWWAFLTLREWRVHRGEIAGALKGDAWRRMVQGQEVPWSEPWAARLLQHKPTLIEDMDPTKVDVRSPGYHHNELALATSNDITGVCDECRWLWREVRLSEICHIREPREWQPRFEQPPLLM